MYQAVWWSMGFQVSQFSGIILAAVLNLNMLQTSLLFSFIQLSIYLASAVYIRLKLPAYYPWWRGGVTRTGIWALGSSMWLTASTLIQQGSTNGVVILVAALSGPIAVPVFTTARTMANLWTNVTNLFTAPLLPDVIRYHAKGEGRKLVSLIEAYWVLVGSAVNIGLIITYPMIEPIYGYWTDHKVKLDNSLLCLLLANIVVINAGGLITLYLSGINRLGVVLTASLLRGTLSLGFGGFLFLTYGLAGLGVGMLCGELLALLVMGRYFVTKELFRQGVNLKFRSFAPITVSAFLALLFLLINGFGLPLTQYIYPVTLLGVAITAVWGWRGLPHDVRVRIECIIRYQVFRKDVA
jgi:O-antigen/teichoic acid export membrane protein